MQIWLSKSVKLMHLESVSALLVRLCPARPCRALPGPALPCLALPWPGLLFAPTLCIEQQTCAADAASECHVLANTIVLWHVMKLSPPPYQVAQIMLVAWSHPIGSN